MKRLQASGRRIEEHEEEEEEEAANQQWAKRLARNWRQAGPLWKRMRPLSPRREHACMARWGLRSELPQPHERCGSLLRVTAARSADAKYMHRPVLHRQMHRLGNCQRRTTLAEVL